MTCSVCGGVGVVWDAVEERDIPCGGIECIVKSMPGELLCKVCLQYYGSVATFSRVRTSDEGGTFQCRHGHIVGVWLDKGQLDLGVIREESP